MTPHHNNVGLKIATISWTVAILLMSVFLLGQAPAFGQTSSPAQQSPSPTAQGGTGTVTFGAGPANAKGLDGRHNFTYSGTPGGVAHDHLAVVNIGGKPLSLLVYATDAFNGGDGALSLPPRATRAKEVGRWVRLDLSKAREHGKPAPGSTQAGSHTLLVPAQSTVIVPFALRIPSDATPGDHVGGLVVSLLARVTNGGGINGHLEQRVGVPIFIRVSGPLRPELSVEQLGISYHQTLNPIGTGTATVTYVVRNTGNVELGGSQTVEVTGLFGSKEFAKNVPSIPLLLPGGTFTVHVIVPGVRPEFFLWAHVTIQPQGRVGDVDPVLPPIEATARTIAIPWLILLLVAALIAGAYAYMRHRRPRPKGPAAETKKKQSDFMKVGGTLG